MVLENFIVDAPIVWDRVGKKIFENPHVKQGRKMRVQITNAGMVEDLSGYTLALGWKHTVSGVDGLDVFEDSSEANVGIFEMAYTENLMTNLGNLKASLVLTSVEDMVVAESNDFYVKVDDSPFGANAEQGVGSYTRLAQILLNEEVRQEAYLANEARIAAIETGVKHEVTNIIEANSDFSSTSGLSLFGATVAASENVLTITGNGISSLPNAGFSISNLPTGSKIYMRVWARVLNSECSKITLRSESTEIASRANPVSGQWYEVSGIRIKSGSLETALNMAMTHTYASSAAANGKQMEVKWAVAIDLTDDFGAGTEPTADYTGMMLKIFPDKYFTGTKFVYPLQVLANDMADAYQVIDDKFDAFVQTNIVQDEVAEVFNNLEETYAQDIVSVKQQLEQKANKKYFREQGTNENAINVVSGSVLNAIAEDLQGSAVSGGGTQTGTENVIGGQWQNVGDNNISNLPTKTGTNAHMSVITGGYDNVNNGLGSFLSGHHNYITENATHSVISGGSGHKFDSGSWAVIAGGQNNTIKGTSANGGVISGGTNNVLDNSVGATINGGGSQSIINSNFSAINGGFGNKIENAANSIIVGGLNNIANSARSTVFGDSAKSTRTAEIAYANGKNVNTGDCQVTQNVMKRTTTDGVNKANILSITANSTAHFKVSVLAMRTDAVGECKSWEITGLLKNVGGTGSIVGSTILNTYDSTGSLPWAVAIVYEGGGLSVQTKGETAKTINWIIKVEMLELKV